MTDAQRIIREVVETLVDESDAAYRQGHSAACGELYREFLGVRRVARAYGLQMPVVIGAHLCGNMAATQPQRLGGDA